MWLDLNSACQLANSGKISRKNGFSLFLAECYKHDPRQQDEHWRDKRKRVFSSSLEKWNERTYEQRCVRKQFSERAKYMNKVSNLERSNLLGENERERGERTLLEQSVKDHQLALFNTAVQQGMICPDGSTHHQPPSTYRPIALANFAAHSGFDNIDPTAIVPHDPVVPQPVAEAIDWQQGLVDSVRTIFQHGQGLHGLADSEFGLSLAVAERASQMDGFVARSSQQFSSLHSQVCLEEPPIKVCDRDHIDNIRSCQQLCGRYCRKEIDNVELFRHCIGMFKTIARIIASRRDIKLGHAFHMSPSCMLPLLLIQTPGGMWGRLVSRISFNPLEIDFIQGAVECSEHNGEHTYFVTLSFEKLPNSEHLCPVWDSMCELGVWLCKHFHGPDRKCTLFLEYDLDSDHDHILVLRSAHESCTVETIDENNFAKLIDKDKKPGKKHEVVPLDEDGAAKSLGKLMSILNKDAKNKDSGSKGQKRNQATSTNALQLIVGKQQTKTKNASQPKKNSTLDD